MESGVSDKLGVKGDAQHRALLDSHDSPLAAGNRLDAGPLLLSTQDARMKIPGKEPTPSSPGSRGGAWEDPLCFGPGLGGLRSPRAIRTSDTPLTGSMELAKGGLGGPWVS